MVSSFTEDDKKLVKLYALYIDERYAENNSSYFPIKVSSVEKAAEKAKEMPYHENDDGIKIYERKTYWNGISEIIIGVNTYEDNRKIIDFINSTHNISRRDIGIKAIISEEAETYFDGKKPHK